MGAFTYPRSEPGSAGHLDLVERLNATPLALRRAIDGMPDAALTHREGDAWSIKHLVAHLSDYGDVFHTRLFRMIKQEEPKLPSWDQAERLAARDIEHALMQDLLYEFSTQRATTVDMLGELVHWNWARQGRHEEHGRLSIRQLVDRALVHDEDQHLPQLRDLITHAQAATGA